MFPVFHTICMYLLVCSVYFHKGVSVSQNLRSFTTFSLLGDLVDISEEIFSLHAYLHNQPWESLLCNRAGETNACAGNRVLGASVESCYPKVII